MHVAIVGFVPGSSPLTRGKHMITNSFTGKVGIIPAHAGKTLASRQTSRLAGDHPRSRGENGVAYARTPRYVGSSPLTRGKQAGQRICFRHLGIIPAHAGKTSLAPTSTGCAEDHPRSRGENTSLKLTIKAGKGSSPLTRGKPDLRRYTATYQGIIPAHAGKTRTSWVRSCRPRDHPRSRGENLLLVLPSGSIQGSSPLTRGKPATYQVTAKLGGIIPAHAGKTEDEQP